MGSPSQPQQHQQANFGDLLQALTQNGLLGATEVSSSMAPTNPLPTYLIPVTAHPSLLLHQSQQPASWPLIALPSDLLFASGPTTPTVTQFPAQPEPTISTQPASATLATAAAANHSRQPVKILPFAQYLEAQRAKQNESSQLYASPQTRTPTIQHKLANHNLAAHQTQPSKNVTSNAIAAPKPSKVTIPTPAPPSLSASSPATAQSAISQFPTPDNVGAIRVDAGSSASSQTKDADSICARYHFVPPGSPPDPSPGAEGEEIDKNNSFAGARMPRVGEKVYKRKPIQKEEKMILKRLFRQDPSPTPAQVRWIAGELGLDRNKVKVWYQNQRAQFRKKQAVFSMRSQPFF
ncbi:hypothetical protein BC830DRAFT_1102121 [Chytriomyces sp. MP71]|nr:hypothetical protein BC830DRAFT_1102121 [Chytriomyces sp. MP71]